MIIFGWLCLLVVTAVAIFYTVAAAYGTALFGGEIGAWYWVPVAICIGLIYATCVNFPFTVTVQP